MKVTEDYFRNLVEEIEDYSIISMDLQGNILSWNKGAEIIGHYGEEIKGKNFSIFYTQADLDNGVPERLLQEAALQGKVVAEGWRLRKDKTLFYAHTVIKAFYEDDELVGFSKVTTDATREKELKDELKASESRLMAVIENSNDAISLCDENFKLTFQSKAGTKITGYSLQDRIEQNAQELIPANEWEAMLDVRKEVLLTPNVAVPFQTRFLHKAGHYIWLEGTITNLLHDPVLQSIVINYRDFTEHKKAEMIIRNSEERLRTINSNLPDSAVYQILASKDGTRKFVYVSENVERLLEVSAEVALEDASAFYNLFPAENIEAIKQAEYRAIEFAIPFKEELPMIMPSGKLKWFSFSSAPRKLSDGSYIWDGVITDISERKKVELALKESESRFKRLTESLPQMVWTFNAAGECDYLSKSWLDYTGVELEEQLGLGWLRQVHPGDRKLVMTGWNKSLEFGVDFRQEFRLRRHDGIYRRFETHVIRLLNSNGQPIMWIGSNTDIEDRKQAEEKQNLLATIITNSNDAIISTDIEGIITSWNPGAEALLGYSSQEIVGLKIDRLFSSDETYREAIRKKIRQGVAFQFESKWLKKDGLEVDISLTLSPIKSIEGKVVGISQIGRDITDRKKSQQLLLEAEKRYRTTLDSMLEGLVILDFNWKFVYVNDMGAVLCHCEKDDLLGQKIMDVFPGIEEKEIFTELDRCMKSRTSVQLETYFEFPNGKASWFEMKMQPAEEGLLVLASEISNRKKAEEEVKDLTETLTINEAKFRALVENTNDLFVILKNKEVTFVSSSVKHILGFSVEEFIELDKGKVIHPDDFPGVIAKIDSLEYVAELEYRHIHKDGSWRWVEGTATNLSHVKGIEGIVFTIRDVTIKKENAEQLKMLNQQITELNVGLEQKITSRTKQLQEANQELEAFTYSVSHDLRSPLRAINGYSKMLEEDFEDHLNEEGKRLLRIVADNAKKMGILIDELLSLSRLGKKELHKQRIDMLELVTDIKNEVEHGIGNTGVISLEHIESAVADGVLIKQVWINLLSNAVKYSSKKHVQKVCVGSYTKDEEIVYWVRDNGCGFNMDYAPKLFGVFQRLHDADEYEGTGVGLAIVKRIVEKHKGRVWAEGVKGKGATFYFTLPIIQSSNNHSEII